MVKLIVDGVEYSSQAILLDEKTPMYSERGDGRVYKFADSNLNELTLSLEGEKLSRCVVTIEVTGTDVKEGFYVDVDTASDG